MKESTIDSLTKLIKQLDIIKKNKKLSDAEKLELILNAFNDIPLDIKNQLSKMKNEVVLGIELPKDFKSSQDGRYIESNTLDRGKYDDLLITISGNFLSEERKKLTDTIIYKLNH